MYEIKYRKEDEIRDSGIEWLGRAPKDWIESKIKNYFKYEKGKKAQMLTKEYISINPGEYPVYSGQTENKGIMGNIDTYEYDLNISLFVTTVGAKVMTPMMLKGKFSLSQNCLIMIRTSEIIEEFVYYWLHPLFRFEKSMIPSYMQPSLRMEDLNRYKIYIPMLIEQKKIANFLDLKTAEFDSIISKKELLIEKLEEAKKSLISEVVTGKVKIIDDELIERKSDEMKDSGVEWLGMIPKDWELKRLKQLSENYPSNIDKKSYPGEKQIRLCNYVDVYYNDYITEDLEFMKATASKSQIRRFALKKGDIVLTKDSESPDDIAIPSYIKESISDLICGYHLMIVKPFNKYISKYIYYQFLTTGVKNYFETVSNGVTRYGIGIGGFNNLSMTLPKKEEQKAIVKSLDNYNRKINSITKKTKLQIQKLKQAKQSLISEAVTGKIDLRDWEIQEI